MITLKYVQLLRRGLETRYLQLLTRAIYLLHAELLQDRVEYIVETEALLAADYETRYALCVEHGLHELTRGRVHLDAFQVAGIARQRV